MSIPRLVDSFREVSSQIVTPQNPTSTLILPSDAFGHPTWIPGTIGKSTRILTTTGGFTVEIGRQIQISGLFITGVGNSTVSLEYNYVANGGSSVNLDFLEISLTTVQRNNVRNITMTLVDINDKSVSVTKAVDLGGSFNWNTGEFFGLEPTAIKSLKLSILVVNNDPNMTQLFLSLIGSNSPSGGGTGFIVNGILENTCGY